jgi:hypothetical protein
MRICFCPCARLLFGSEKTSRQPHNVNQASARHQEWSRQTVGIRKKSESPIRSWNSSSATPAHDVIRDSCAPQERRKPGSATPEARVNCEQSGRNELNAAFAASKSRLKEMPNQSLRATSYGRVTLVATSHCNRKTRLVWPRSTAITSEWHDAFE